MKLYVIFGQRKESYPGQFAPEALDVMDEFGRDENGEWLDERLAIHRETGEFTAVELVCVSLGPTALKNIQVRLTGTLEVSGAVEENQQ